MPPQVRKFRRARPLYRGVVFDGTNGQQIVDWLAQIWPDCDIARMGSGGVLLYPNPAAPMPGRPDLDWIPAPAGMLFSVCRTPGHTDFRHVRAGAIADEFDEDLT